MPLPARGVVGTPCRRAALATLDAARPMRRVGHALSSGAPAAWSRSLLMSSDVRRQIDQAPAKPCGAFLLLEVDLVGRRGRPARDLNLVPERLVRIPPVRLRH